jgi:hypothetical protein
MDGVDDRREVEEPIEEPDKKFAGAMSKCLDGEKLTSSPRSR